jgi:hypothetical protein
MALLLFFFGTIVFNVVVTLLSEDMSEWVTAAAKWFVRRYAAKWPAAHGERITGECLADLADTRGILHTLKFIVGLGLRVREVPLETASTLHVNVSERIRLSDCEAPGGGDVTVALTGVSATGRIGSLLPSTSVPPIISTTDVPFVSSYDGANDVVLRHWEAQRRATYRIAANSNPTSPAVLWFASS